MFFVMLAKMLMRLVRALNEFITPENTNKPKKAVIKYFSSKSGLNISLRKGNFKNKIKSKAVYTPVTRMLEYIYLLIIGSFFFVGVLFIYSSKGGSNEKASPANVSIIILIHNICMTVIGVLMFKKGPKMLNANAQRFIVS